MLQYFHLEEDHVNLHHSKRSRAKFLLMVLCNWCRFSKLEESMVAETASTEGAQFERPKCKDQEQQCNNVENNIEMSCEVYKLSIECIIKWMLVDS